MRQHQKGVVFFVKEIITGRSGDFARYLFLCYNKRAKERKQIFMKNYKILLQYDGTRYKGWQVQKSTDMTIQGKLQAVLEKMSGCPVEVHGSGRTDAGVHALAQVANFKIDVSMTETEILDYMNAYLPEDIFVYEIAEVPMRFHSRLNAVSKTYRYRICNAKRANVFERKYVEVITEPLDVEKMREAAAWLIGEHDFRAFCGKRNQKKSTVRTITEILIEDNRTKENYKPVNKEKRNEEVVISISGNGFLQNMVRIIVGTLVEAGLGKREPESIKEILEKKDRSNAGYTISPRGLALAEVKYD